MSRTVSIALACLVLYSLFGVLTINSVNEVTVRPMIQTDEYHFLGQTSLQNGIPVNSTLLHTGDSKMYAITVESYASIMRCILICPDDADFDLYGKLGSEPTEDVYDLRGYESGNEDVIYDAPIGGIWYFMVHSYDGKGSYELTVTITYVKELQVGITVSSILEQTEEWDIWRITVSTNVTSMNIILECEPNNDFDVLGRQGEQPTTYTYDWKSDNLGNENFTYENPAKGTWFIMVVAYEGYGSYNITVNFEYGNTGFFAGPVVLFFSSPFGISLTTAIAVGIALFVYYRARSPRGGDQVITGYEEYLAPKYDSVHYDEPRFCIYCGTQFKPGSNVCQKCGARRTIE